MSVAIFIIAVHAPLAAFAFARSWRAFGFFALACVLLVGVCVALAYWSPKTNGQGYWQLGIVLAVMLPVGTSLVGAVLGIFGLILERKGWSFNQRAALHFGLLAALIFGVPAVFFVADLFIDHLLRCLWTWA
jgi:hypothetical protein